MNKPEAKPQNTSSKTHHPCFLAYALPRAEGENDDRVIKGNGFVIHDVPASGKVSFLDFDGVVFFGGAFEQVVGGGYRREMVCTRPADLDLRDREVSTLLERGGIVIILLHLLPQAIEYRSIDDRVDLFRRIAASLGIGWESSAQPSPLVDSLVPEFRDFISRFGAGYISFDYRSQTNNFLKPICVSGQAVYGVSIADKIFMMPCVVPQNSGQLESIVTNIVAATISYRRRISREMPLWVSEFGFEKERELQLECGRLQRQATKLEGEIAKYAQWKGALVFQSDPLVDVVVRMFDHFFGIKLTVDDKKIEDATLRDADGAILAIGEIKGVNGTVKRTNVNQVDSHRERLGLHADTPGFLVMNTLMGADSLAAKDEKPHPDIIKKAVAERVIFIRTLDLLKFADGVERGVFDAGRLREFLLGSGGWLCVEGDKAEIITG